MQKIVTVIGARPQFIKAAAVSRSISGVEGLQEVILHTGQHFDDNMSKVFFDQMSIPRPAYNLGVHSMDHGAMTGAMLAGIEEILKSERPDLVLVYGDTNSTLSGALAASKMGIPVAHVEAGLRSFNMAMPEEINRIVTDRLSTWLFCPTKTAVHNLITEGYKNFGKHVHLTGDVMYDAMLIYRHVAHAPSDIQLPTSYVLATIHRAENTDDPVRLRAVVESLNAIADSSAVVLPLHPRTRRYMKAGDLPALNHGIIVTAPLGYLEMIYLLEHCNMVVTDSGGLQKEAYFFGKPCITVREETEWTELVEAGCNTICGSNKERILQAFKQYSDSTVIFPAGLYGNGNASEQIVQALLNR
jgi:UDP-GlcNAc3NAcA epimerase